MCHENEDDYAEFYAKTKLTIEEMKNFPELKKYSDDELSQIAESIYDLAVLTKKII